MTLQDILMQALRETRDTNHNKPNECECNCEKAEARVRHIVIDTEHVLFEVRITEKGEA